MKTYTTLTSKKLTEYLQGKYQHIRSISKKELAFIASKPNIDPNHLSGEVDSEYAGIIHHIKAFVSPMREEIKRKRTCLEYDRVKKETAEKLDELKQKQDSVSLDVARTEPEKKPWQFVVPLVFTLLLVVGDVALNYRSFQVATGSVLTAFVVALVTMFVLGMTAHFVGEWMKSKVTLKGKLLAFLAGMGIATAFVILMATARQQLYGSESTIIWAGLNLIYFAVAIYVTYRFTPAKIEWLQWFDHIRFTRKLAKLNAEEKAEHAHLEAKKAKDEELHNEIENLKQFEEDTITGVLRERDILYASAQKEYAMRGGGNKPIRKPEFDSTNI